MKIVFKSNLDVVQKDIATLNRAAYLHPNTPRVGERIKFLHCNRSYELEVCAVTYVLDTHVETLTNVVELHIPSYYKSLSILEWEQWFRNHIGAIR